MRQNTRQNTVHEKDNVFQQTHSHSEYGLRTNLNHKSSSTSTSILFLALLVGLLSSLFLHPYIAEQALQAWPDAPQEFRDNIGNYRGERTCSQAHSGSTITEGSSDEDAYDIVADLCNDDSLWDWPYINYGVGFMHHFYDTTRPEPNNGLYLDAIGVEMPGALMRALIYWFRAKQNYSEGNTDLAFLFLGRTAHLLADLSVPAHVHNDSHGTAFDGFDSYETYMKSHYANWNSGGAVIPENLTFEDIFRNLARHTQYFPSDDYLGSTTNTEPDWFPLGDNYIADTNLEKIGEKMIPQAIGYTTALYKLFWEQVSPSISAPSYIGVLDTITVSGGGTVDGTTPSLWQWDFEYDGTPANFEVQVSGQTATHNIKLLAAERF
jgi:hypothetical protein